MPFAPRRIILAAVVALSPGLAVAGTATVAVAANFTVTLEKLVARFEAGDAHDIRIVPGSTGKLTVQIMHGAPFDIFLAADAERPALLVAEGRARAEDRRVYALGRLALWSRNEVASEDLLRNGRLPRLAIANPDLAPYGAAAEQVLTHYGRTGDTRPAIVRGENITQAIAMLATGNVDYGLVPLSVQGTEFAQGGHLWTIPPEAHAPIRQDAVLLKRGTTNPAAAAFFAFLTSQEARAIILADGYETGAAP